MVNRLKLINSILHSDNDIVTGIGSRKTNRAIDYVINRLAMYLAGLGFTIRSGGAEGSDDAFEINHSREIYLPWDGFNNKYKAKGDYILPDDLYSGKAQLSQKAANLARVHFKGFDYVSDGVKSFMKRNMHQVLGKDLETPTGAIFCYTKDGCDSMYTRTSKTGGTGAAISLASELDIPIVNIGIYDNMLLIMYLLNIPIQETIVKKKDYVTMDTSLELVSKVIGATVSIISIKDFK